LGKRLRIVAPQRQPILLMDAHKVHCSKDVLMRARKDNIFVCIISASTTALLQPLDTDVFARYQAFFRHELQRYMSEGANQDLQVVHVTHALQNAMKGVLQRHAWQDVVDGNGFGTVLKPKASLLRALDWEKASEVSAELPTLEQFSVCFPRHTYIPFGPLLSGLVLKKPKVTCSTTPKVKAKRKDSASDHSWSKRLRPRHKHSSEANASTALSGSKPPNISTLPAGAASSTWTAPAVLPRGPVLKSLKRFPRLRAHAKDDATETPLPAAPPKVAPHC